jgi:hypothetical protein
VLQAAVIRETTERLREVDLDGVIDPWPTRRSLLVATIAALVVAMAWTQSPDVVQLAAARLTQPLAPYSWPKRHMLAFENPPTRLALERPFEVELSDRAGELPDEVLFHVQDDDGTMHSEPMQPRGDRVFARRENVRRGFWYRATGGDDTEMEWIRLDVSEPPRVAQLQLTLTPPAYSGLPASTSDGPIDALVGTSVAMDGRVTRPISRARVRFDSGRSIALGVSSDGLRFSLSPKSAGGWQIDQARAYSIELVDRADSRIIGGSDVKFAIHPRPDNPPVVTLNKPSTSQMVVSRATIPIEVEAKDDLAIERIAVALAPAGGATGPSARRDLWIGDRDPPSRSGDAAFDVKRARHTLELAPLLLSPGTQLELVAEAHDYQPAVGRSSPVRIQIVSPEEFEDQLLARQTRILTDLAEALRAEREALAGAEAFAAGAGEKSWRQQLDRAQTSDSAQRQVTRLLVDPVEGVLAQATALIEDLKINRHEDAGARRVLEQLADGLKSLAKSDIAPAEHATGSAVRATQAASRASDSADEARRAAQSMRTATEHQRQIIAALESTDQTLNQWDSHRRLARDVKRVREQQQQLDGQIADQATATLGKRTDQLTAEEKANLDRLAPQQQNLASAVEKLVARMEQLAERLRASDVRAAAAVDAAARAGRDSALAGEMRDAARNLAENQLGEAQQRSERIARELAKMEDLIEGRTPAKTPADQMNPRSLVDLKALRDQQQDVYKRTLALEQNSRLEPLSPELKQELESLRAAQSRLADEIRSLTAPSAQE